MSMEEWLNANLWSLFKMVWPLLVAGALASVGVGVWMTRFYALVLRGVNEQHRVLALLLNHRHDEEGEVTFDKSALSGGVDFTAAIMKSPAP